MVKLKKRTAVIFFLILVLTNISTFLLGSFFGGERVVSDTVVLTEELLEGEWALYLDCPNTIYHFKDDTLEIGGCDGSYKNSETTVIDYTISETGDRVIFERNGEERTLYAVKVDNEVYLLPFEKFDYDYSAKVFRKSSVK